MSFIELKQNSLLSEVAHWMEQLDPSFPSLAFVSASSGASSEVTGPGVGTGAGANTGEPEAAAGAGEGARPGEDAAGTDAGAGAGGASLMAAGWACQMVGDAVGVLELKAGNCWELATFAVKGLAGPAWMMLWAGAMLTLDSVTGAGS